MKIGGAVRREFLIETLIRVAGFSAIFFVILIFLFLLREGAPAFWEVSLGNFFGQRWYPNEELFGTWPLILGSWYGLLPALFIAMLFIIRTHVEDKYLRAHLTGYAAYAKKTRYRLLPFVW